MTEYRIFLTDKGQALTYVNIAMSKAGFGRITAVPETIPADIASRYIDKTVFSSDIQPGMFFMYWSIGFEQKEEATETTFMVRSWIEIKPIVVEMGFKLPESFQRKEHISHITSMRTKGLLHRVQIMQELQLSDLDYGRIIDKAGQDFLRDMYPKEMKEYVAKIQKEKIFWNWWRTGFVSWEESFIHWAYSNEYIPTAELFADFIAKKAQSETTAGSFANLLNALKHVKL